MSMTALPEVGSSTLRLAESDKGPGLGLALVQSA